VFEEETEKKGSQDRWELVTNAPTEHRKLLQVLTSAWKSLFRVELSVLKL
jgi:hypothetical protein